MSSIVVVAAANRSELSSGISLAYINVVLQENLGPYLKREPSTPVFSKKSAAAQYTARRSKDAHAWP